MIQLLKEKLIKESAYSDSWIKDSKPTWFLLSVVHLAMCEDLCRKWGEITCNNIGTWTGDYLADVCFLLFRIDAILYPEGLEQLSTF